MTRALLASCCMALTACLSSCPVPDHESLQVPALHPVIINLPHPTQADEVPYPNAQAPDPMPSVAMSPESDCSGLIAIVLENPRVGVWAIGPADEEFEPLLYFNTGEDAQDCAGSSGSPVWKLTRTGWVSVDSDVGL